MKYQVYVKKEIKSEADLPKEDKWYIGFSGVINDFIHFNPKTSICKDIDWYLQPIELDMPDDTFDKINCLLGYLERWLNNPYSTPPFELKDVIEEANTWLKDKIENQLK
jgi:hypothetical protein